MAPQSAATKMAWPTYPLAEAFTRSIDTRKPLVVYIGQDVCAFCRKLEEGPLASNALKKLADRGVWAWVNFAEDDPNQNVSRFLAQMQVDKVPTTTVVKASKEGLQEVGRIVGYYPSEEYQRQLTRLLDQAAAPTDPSPGSGAPVPVQGPPEGGIISTVAIVVSKSVNVPVAKLDLSKTLASQGLDELDLLEVIEAIEKEFKVKFTDEETGPDFSKTTAKFSIMLLSEMVSKKLERR